MKIRTIYNMKVNDTGVLNSIDVMEINAPFVIVILCQINSLLQKKDRLYKTKITMIIVCMPLDQVFSKTNIFPRIEKVFKDILLIWPNFY